MGFGKWLEQVLSVQAASSLGAVILIGVGIWIYYETAIQHFGSAIRRKLNQFLRPTAFSPCSAQDPRSLHQSVRADRKQRKSITWRETLVLGVSLALNAMAGGVGASLSGYHPGSTSSAIGIFSYLTIYFGQKLSGTYLSKWLGTFAQKGAGILLILIGIYEFFF